MICSLPPNNNDNHTPAIIRSGLVVANGRPARRSDGCIFHAVEIVGFSVIETHGRDARATITKKAGHLAARENRFFKITQGGLWLFPAAYSALAGRLPALFVARRFLRPGRRSDLAASAALLGSPVGTGASAAAGSGSCFSTRL